MTEQALATTNNPFMPAMVIGDAIARRNALVEFVKAVMVDKTDYGVIPGTDKPTLLKPGAEKLNTLFGLSSRFTIIEKETDWTGKEHGGEPFFYFVYRCQLWRGDRQIAESDGSCNSMEKKYRYRKGERVCPECGKPAIKRSKFPPREDPTAQPGWYCYDKIGGCGYVFLATDPRIIDQQVGQVINPDIAEQVNTIQKMAQKRALIAATLLAVNASEFFTQDVEDMDYIDAPYTARDQPPAQKAAPPPTQQQAQPPNGTRSPQAHGAPPAAPPAAKKDAPGVDAEAISKHTANAKRWLETGSYPSPSNALTIYGLMKAKAKEAGMPNEELEKFSPGKDPIVSAVAHSIHNLGEALIAKMTPAPATTTIPSEQEQIPF